MKTLRPLQGEELSLLTLPVNEEKKTMRGPSLGFLVISGRTLRLRLLLVDEQKGFLKFLWRPSFRAFNARMDGRKDFSQSSGRSRPKNEAENCKIGRPVSTHASSSEAEEGNYMLSSVKHSRSIETANSQNLDYSHFISLPLAIHPELVRKVVQFQNNLLGMATAGKRSNLAVEKASTSSTLSDSGIDKSIFINPRTLHLTVLMLKLWNKDRIDTTIEVLQSVSSKVMKALDNRPVFVTLQGLDLMRGSPAEARVLHARVEEVGNEGRLLRACKAITDAFVDAGLVLEKDRNKKLKLHATLMNAKYRKGKPGSIKMEWFDARGIFERYGEEEWGDYLISEAHLSQRFVYDGSGYFHCCASIPFPQSSLG